MFARVISAQVGAEGVDELVRSAHAALPTARDEPGFAGYLVLTDHDRGDALVISLWQTREDMEAISRGTQAGIRDGDQSDAVAAAMRLATYEVALQV